MISKNKIFDRRVLVILIAFEAVLFCSFFFREIAWYSPQNFDQTLFLTEAYRLEERVYSKGLGELWNALWSKGNPSGLLLPIEGAFAGLLLGGTRLPQLLVLFTAFSALQVFAFSTARAVWDCRAYGYMVLGLILCQTTGWFWAGGMFDFRMDFVAYCLYGIWACAVIRSNLFLERRWAIGCGLISAFLALHRFITITYLLGVSVGFSVACIVVCHFMRGDSDLPDRLKRRLFNLAIASVVLIVVTGPVLLANWTSIHNYYVIGHLTGAEKYVRATEFGVTDLVGSLLYYPKSIVIDHLGPTFLWGSLLAIAAGVIARLVGRVRNFKVAEKSRTPETLLLQIIFLLGAILGPVVVLTFDTSKSPVVGGVVGVPMALLVVVLTTAATPNFRDPENSSALKLIGACSILIFVLGLFTQFRNACRHLPEYAERRDLKRLTELDRWLVQYASDFHWTNPRLSLDVISGLLNVGAIATSGFEQTGALIEFRPMLGSGIMGVDRQTALSLLANSDFVILTTIEKKGVYPFYEQIARYWNDLKAWADQHMITAQIVPLDNFTVTVYVRPTVKVSGNSGNWVTRDGLTLDAGRNALERFPEIQLSGTANYSWLPKIPAVSATIGTGAEAQTVPASFHRNDNSYEILVDLADLKLPPQDPVQIHLHFDTFFVPKKIGLNEDTRELVINAPSQVQLIPK
jgi:hypothetical protein